MTNLHPEAVAMLERMAGVYDWQIQVGVALFKETPQHILRLLCEEDYVQVRLAVASNLSTSFDTLEILISDDDADVRRFAQENLMRRATAETRTRKARLSQAQNPNTPTEELEKLAKDENVLVATQAKAQLYERLTQPKND